MCSPRPWTIRSSARGGVEEADQRRTCNRWPSRVRVASAATSSTDPDHPSTARLAGDDRVERRLESVQVNLGDRVGETTRPQIRGESAPDALPFADRHLRRLDPDQRNATEDERQNSRRQLRATGVAGRGNRAAGLEGPHHVRQRPAADRVDRAGPPPALERLPRRSDVLGGDEPDGAETAKAILLGLLPCRGPDLVAPAGEDPDGATSDAAGGAGDEDGTRRRGEPTRLEGDDAQGRSEA